MFPDDAPPTPPADARRIDEAATISPPTAEVESTRYTSPPDDPGATHDEIPPPVLEPARLQDRTTLSSDEFLDSLLALPLLDAAQQSHVDALRAQFNDMEILRRALIQRGLLTSFQADQIAHGRGNDLVLNRYVLLSILGQGGMGTVYLARQQHLKRLVAIKLIRRDALNTPGAVQRFQREVQIAAQLLHPNIAIVYDCNETKGVNYMAMEYIEGHDLAKVVKERGPLPVSFACDCIRQAALGLQYAHEMGLIHRDIKPHNLMLTVEGAVKVMDLGLARFQTIAGQESEGLTATGAVMGTPDYLAPEQALNAKGVDVRADIYSLGCTLYHLLTGRPPFLGTTMTEKLLKHQLEEPEPLEELRADAPQDLAVLVRKMMAKKAEQRYQTPQEVANALRGFISRPMASAVERTAAPSKAKKEIGRAAPTEAIDDALFAWDGILDSSQPYFAVKRTKKQAQRNSKLGDLILWFACFLAFSIVVATAVVLYCLFRTLYQLRS